MGRTIGAGLRWEDKEKGEVVPVLN